MDCCRMEIAFIVDFNGAWPAKLTAEVRAKSV